MDDNKTNQSIDGMMGGEPNQPVNSASPSMDGFKSQHSNVSNDKSDETEVQNSPELDNYDQHQSSKNQVTSGDGGSNKKLKVLLTLFVILFIAASAAAAYFYTQKSAPAPTNNNSAAILKLQQQNDSLTYDNKNLNTTNALLITKNKNLTSTANQLKTKCASGCTAIVIPQ